MSGTRKTVFIAVPCFGRVINSETVHSLIALGKALTVSGYDFYYSSQSHPDIADLRDKLTTIWFDGTQADYMLWVDADMGFEPQMVLDMLAFDKPVVGCMYPVKDLPIRFNARLAKGPQKIEAGHLQVEGCGFGVTLIRRDCIERMLEAKEAWSDTRLSFDGCREQFAALGLNRIIRVFQKEDTEAGYLSEDYSFFRRVIRSGMEVWANIGHAVTHVGYHGYKARYLDCYLAEQRAESMRGMP